MFTLKNIIYIISLAFQIAGAILLIIKYWGKTRQRIIDVYFPGTGIANNDGNNNAVLDLIRTRYCAFEIYNNRMAFIFITIGYTISIFGEKQFDNNFLVLLVVLAITTIVIGLEWNLAKLVARKKYTKEIVIPYEDLPNYINGTISPNDIHDLFK